VSDLLAPVAFWLIILVPMVIFVWQMRRVRHGEVGKLRSLAKFFAFAMIPLLAYGLSFAALVGIEELAGQSLIGEGIARALIPAIVVGLGEVLLLSLLFAIVVSFMKPNDKAQ
jgi:hypothetical protein